MSETLEHSQPCKDCGSSDALAIYEDHTYCFSCYKWTGTDMENVVKMPKPTQNWSERNIFSSVSAFYDVQVEDSWVRFPYFTNDGLKMATKSKSDDRKYFTEGDMSGSSLFGVQTMIKDTNRELSNTLILTEGEADALAAFQMANRLSMDNLDLKSARHTALSIKSGAGSAERDVKENLELVESFERVFICFDSDDQGRNAAQAVARLISPGKARIVQLDLKDASEYTTKGMTEAFLSKLKNAEVFKPNGIENASDNFESLWEDQSIRSIPFPWAKLEDRTMGIRSREIITWAAGTGVGKSSFMRELEHFYLKSTDKKIGIIALEESNQRTKRGILAIEANDRLHLNEVFEKYTQEEIKVFFNNTLGTGRVYLYDHFGSMDIDDLMDSVRYMVVAMDCEIIFIDHLSILVSGLDVIDERKAIDKAMTMLRQLTEETGCAIHLVTHLRRLGSDRSHEDGAEINLAHLRGSHGISQISDTVVALERNTQSEDAIEANTTTLRVLKCRYTGDTGACDRLFYNKLNGRLEVLKEEF